MCRVNVGARNKSFTCAYEKQRVFIQVNFFIKLFLHPRQFIDSTCKINQ